jgi:hypothetical protein
MTNDRDTKNAKFYVSVGWKNLEFEEKADARRLVREGYLSLCRDTLALLAPKSTAQVNATVAANIAGRAAS